MSDPADVLRSPARLAALAATGLPDSPPEEAFDRLTRLASRALQAPVALVSLLDDRRQFFKSRVGLPEGAARETPVEVSVCQHTVAGGCALAIPDLAADPRTAGNAALAASGLRAYLGVPLVTPEGHALGTLCVADVRPRAWTDGDRAVLEDLAAVATGEIERRRAEAERAATTDRFRALVEQSIAGFYLIERGELRYVNPRLAESLGFPAGYFDLPRPLLPLVHPDDAARVAENLRRREDGEVGELRYAFRAVRPDGTVVHLEVHGRGVPGEAGGVAVLGVAIDVTDRVRAEEERAAALAARDRFYAMLSHELRTPISSIMLYNDLLLSGVPEPLTEGQRESVERGQRSAQHLLDLINDLLDLSKLEAGRMDARLEDVEVVELTESAVSAVAPLAADHGCALRLEAAERPLPVLGDARRVRQILLNLLSNAVKFGRGAPVEVRCARVAAGVVVEVCDHGRGIAAADLPRIFEEFVQLGEDDDEVGTGLGLPIARRLAELMGGSLTARSEPGVGSTFRLFLPVAPPAVA